MVAVQSKKLNVWTGANDNSVGVWPATFKNKESKSTSTDGIGWVSAVHPNSHQWGSIDSNKSELTDCVQCASEVDTSDGNVACTTCGLRCHAECVEHVPDSCGVDARDLLTQRELRTKHDIKENDLFLGVPSAFTAPDKSKPGRVIIAHPVSTKGAKQCGEFALIDQKWPLAKSEYNEWFSHRERPVTQFNLGAFQLVEVDEDIWIANVLVHDGTRVQLRALKRALHDLMLHAIKTDSVVHLSKSGWLAENEAFVALVNELPALMCWMHESRVS
eukprot:CAMPEP_0168604288 /NCGR_PEP_ID=MMETSP0420-20121227/15214_1 /TAXON_ID=498008 /ORGANISM="Pessonella sp." /LENGTH=273 /DNA_ID=CAMNT_0008643389 /DNA_START=697 /DNA_END=1514 /DNA_ORIENTATION=-